MILVEFSLFSVLKCPAGLKPEDTYNETLDLFAYAEELGFHAGRRAEWLAHWYLRVKGYRIVASNLRLTGGEIDIVAQKGRLLAFIEVKARRDLAEAGEAVRPQQQARIAAAAQAFMASRPRYRDMDGRFDALLLAPGRLPRHIRDAWRL